MSQPFIGQIKIFGGNFAPAGHAFCDGALMPIVQNEALFSLIGTTYGGDGQTTFAVPDLRGRVPVHQGTGAGLTARVLGQTGGTETVTLTAPQLPAHSHPASATNAELGCALKASTNDGPYKPATSQSSTASSAVQARQRGCSTWYSTELPSGWAA